MSEGGLFDGILGRGPAAEAASDRAWLASMLEAEVALARACASSGIIPRNHADAIADACRTAELSVASIGAGTAATGTPVVSLLDALRGRLDPEVADSLHRGATSQDIVDTAAMLVARRALTAMLDDLAAAADAVADLADAHRRTLMVARTLQQHALPATFGVKAAGWLGGLDAAVARLRWACDTQPAIQLGGAAGTLASLGAAGPDVVRAFAAELGLPEPKLPWHAERSRVVGIAGALALASAVMGKVALDLVLLAQSDVAEVRDASPGRGGSSTLPHKRNPVAAVAVRACVAAVPGHVATLTWAAGAGEHERAAGAWQAEWRPLSELLRLTGSAAAWLRDAVTQLEVDADRMRVNLDRSAGVLLAERVTDALATSLGRAAARREVEAAVREASAGPRSFDAALLARPAVAAHLDESALAALLEPSTYLGSAERFVDAALAAHREQAGR